MTIEITEEHIKKGAPGSGRNPITIALRERIHPRLRDGVRVGFFRVGHNEHWPAGARGFHPATKLGELDHEAQEFLRAFDDCPEIKPKPFNLRISAEALMG